MIDWKDYWEVIMCSNLNFLKFLDPIPRCVWGGSYFLTTVCLLSHFSLYTSLWNSVGLQAPLSKGFSRQEHWSGLPFPSLGDIPDPGIKPASLYVSCIVRQVFFFLILEPPGNSSHRTKRILEHQRDTMPSPDISRCFPSISRCSPTLQTVFFWGFMEASLHVNS